MVPETGQCEAQIVACRRKARIGFYGSHEGVAGFLVALHRDERQTQAVPSIGPTGVHLQHLLVEFKTLLDTARLDPQEPEIEARVIQSRAQLESAAERRLRVLVIVPVGVEDPDIVPCQSVLLVDRESAAVRFRRLSQPAHLV